MPGYTRQINAVHRVMLRSGQVVTVTRRTSGDYDVSTGAVAITETTESGYGLPTDYKRDEIDGETVQQGDIKLLLSPTGITKPQINDEVTLSSGTFTIKSVNELSPGGSAILYKCQLR